MSSHPDPTIFESLNARQLSPKQVARTFVPTDNFDLLLERNHNVIVGPRGSGKTTLLKMLQISALCNWTHDRASEVSEKIDFVSAFVPTDIAWEKQWSLLDTLAMDDERKELHKNAIFATHTIRAVIEAYRDCCDQSVLDNGVFSKFFVSLPKKKEAELCAILASNLKLKLLIPSLDYVELALRQRLLEVGEVINRHRAGDIDRPDLDFVFLSFMDCITTTLDALNLFSGRRDQKWALLFDELELAPVEVRKTLMSDLRSTDSRIYFKLSMSPYSEDFKLFAEPTSPSAGHDYKPITLWYSQKEQARPFCDSLFSQMCVNLDLDGVRPVDVFAHSEFEMGNVTRMKGQTAYAVDSPIHKRFTSLAAKDDSFREYLDKRGIDLDKLDEMPENDRASRVRKVTNLVTVRDEWRRKAGLSSKTRLTLYTGATSLFDLTEGNPRLFIGIVGPLLQQYASHKKTIGRARQEQAVRQATHRFRALLSTIPIDSDLGTQKIRGMNDLLDILGRFFFDRVVRDDFSADPPTTFVVDDNTPPQVERALGRAVNAGAIVYMQAGRSDLLLQTLRHRRFRLTYLLAPHYKLPLLANKHRDLSTILNSDREEKVERDMFNELVS